MPLLSTRRSASTAASFRRGAAASVGATASRSATRRGYVIPAVLGSVVKAHEAR